MHTHSASSSLESDAAESNPQNNEGLEKERERERPRQRERERDREREREREREIAALVSVGPRYVLRHCVMVYSFCLFCVFVQ